MRKSGSSLCIHAAVEEEDVKSEIRECRNMGGIRFNPLEKEDLGNEL